MYCRLVRHEHESGFVKLLKKKSWFVNGEGQVDEDMRLVMRMEEPK